MKRTVLNKSELTERWSRTLVERYAPHWVRRHSNRYHTITLFFDLEDIKRIEQDEAFCMEWQKAKNRKAAFAAKKAKKKAELEEYYAKMRPLMHEQLNEAIATVEAELAEELDDWDVNDLIGKALYNYNAIQNYYNPNHWWREKRDCTQEFLIEKAQAFVRHEVTSYDELWNNHPFLHDELQNYINDRVEKHIISQWTESA